MRLAGVAAAALVAVSACAGPAGAQARPPAALEAGQTLLEIEAAGKVKSVADAASLYVVVNSTAASAAQARAQNSARIDRVTAAAKSAGAASVEANPAGNGWRVGFVGNAALEAVSPAAMRTAGKTETAMLEVRLADPDRVESVRAAVEQAGADQVTGPFYRLADDSAARRTARQRAISQARAEADDYAGALGMRVVRILRVSERVAPYGDPEELETVYAAMGLGASPSREIETSARIAVDFALAPR